MASYQHPNGSAIDWMQVAGSGRAFAVIKATELYTGSDGRPALYTNPYLSADLRGAEAAGLVVGTYAFAHPENDARTQADEYAQAVGVLPSGSLPPVLDLEVSGGLSVPQLIAWTYVFLDRLAADTGIIPMIYTGPGFWNSALGGTADFASYPLWQATYTSAGQPPGFGGWSSYTLWQYTDSASVPGISGAVDESRFRGTRADLTAIAQPDVPASLYAPQGLATYQSLRSHNRQYRLVLQGDGNLVSVGMGHALWSTGTSGHPGARLALLPGRAVLYGSADQELWSTGAAQGAGAILTVQDDGQLVLRNSAGPIWHNGAPGSNTLTVGGALLTTQYLHTPYGQSQLLMQSDGNLVLRRNRLVLWSSGSNGFPGAHLVLQSDGNLVVYDTTYRPRWSSGTSGRGTHTFLVLQSDGNLVLYGPAGALWNTHTRS